MSTVYSMSKGRAMTLLTVAGLWIGTIAWRLVELQVRRHEHFREQAEEQQQDVVVLSPPRGTIYDTHGRELAVSVEVASAAADPTMIESPTATAGALGGVAGNGTAKLAAALASNRRFVWIERKLEPERATAVRDLDLDGVFLLRESKRYYPLGRLAAQVLGYVGIDNSGLAGLEFLYDAEVTSEPGRRRVVRDAKRGTVLYPNLDEEPTPGQDLHLTLDAAIQHIVERELAAAIRESGARRGTIVVMDPGSGAILAMASHPSFDPNDFAASPREHWRNRSVTDAFEPGSTFKMLTLAAALEAGVVDPLETIDCEMGGIMVAGARIADHAPFGMLTTREIIAKSSNVGAIKLGFAAGRERLYKTIRAFGFGRRTGVDLPSESPGIVWPLEKWSKRSPAYVSFGHAVSVTALQLTRAFAVIANGGRLMEPYVVAKVGDGPAREPRLAGQPIAPSSVLQVRSMLESVVLEGTAKSAALAGHRAAGKTGTAQKAVPGRGYVDGKYIASFVGFAPIKDPALVAAIILDEPWPRYHGGEVAAPVFQRIASQALLYLGVEPDRDDAPRPSSPPLQVRVAKAEPPATPRPPAADRSGEVPDLTGLSARQAVSLSADLGLRLTLTGHGAVARQEPPPGTALPAGGAVEVWLEGSGVM